MRSVSTEEHTTSVLSEWGMGGIGKSQADSGSLAGPGRPWGSLGVPGEGSRRPPADHDRLRREARDNGASRVCRVHVVTLAGLVLARGAQSREASRILPCLNRRCRSCIEIRCWSGKRSKPSVAPARRVEWEWGFGGGGMAVTGTAVS